jgi:hypothetical protein
MRINTGSHVNKKKSTLIFLVDREKDAKGKKRNKRSREKKKRPSSLRTGPVQHLLAVGE